jgi:nicotinamidase-related amidase
MSEETKFKPAILIIDVQEDFCPPNGSLAVTEGRAILPAINTLLTYPFALRIATKDWHPKDHVSFASNHKDAQPYTSFTTIINPENDHERYESRLWPDHCVQGTQGAELIPNLDLKRVDRIIEKGQDARIEMYSAFYPPLENPRMGDSGLAKLLREADITDVYVVGLASDYCVHDTAKDAVKEGFQTWIVEDATRAVDPDSWAKMKAEMLANEGVKVIQMTSPEVMKVKEMA